MMMDKKDDAVFDNRVESIPTSPELFNPSSLNDLCLNLEDQIKTNTYDMSICLAILRLYAFFPPCLDEEVVRKILVKGVMKLPHPHVMAYLALIPENQVKNPKIQQIVQLSDLLEECRFKQVWEMLKDPSLRDVLGVPGFLESVRRFICECIGCTYYTLSLSDFCQFLNVPMGGEVDKIVKAYGWAVEDNKTVRIVSPSILHAALHAQKEDPRKSNSQSNLIHKCVGRSLTTDSLKTFLKQLQ